MCFFSGDKRISSSFFRAIGRHFVRTAHQNKAPPPICQHTGKLLCLGGDILVRRAVPNQKDSRISLAGIHLFHQFQQCGTFGALVRKQQRIVVDKNDRVLVLVVDPESQRCQRHAFAAARSTAQDHRHIFLAPDNRFSVQFSLYGIVQCRFKFTVQMVIGSLQIAIPLRAVRRAFDQEIVEPFCLYYFSERLDRKDHLLR